MGKIRITLSGSEITNKNAEKRPVNKKIKKNFFAIIEIIAMIWVLFICIKISFF